jgi:hypothetical protein
MYAMLPQHLAAEAMERPYVCPVFEAWGKSGDSALHFVSGFVRKGEGKQTKALASRSFQQRRDAAGENLGFA